MDTIEDEIMALEMKIEEIKMNIADAGSDFEKVQLFFDEQQTLETELGKKMDRWEELSILVEEIEESNG